MKNNIRKIALGLCLTGALTACDLDVVPPADIAAENFWQTEKDAWYALNTCYATLDGVDIWDELCTTMRIAINLGKETSKWSSKMVLVQPTDMGATILVPSV
ncbi:hypothetical protein LA344_17125 [Bacteroides fragilis]|nr:hypothetical protein [Bacteroides fragilis]MCA5595932.1 hypothetical protein [Bacteroides fragilis]